ncbi:RNA-directed DNA polymerase, eukaryota, reverse transcriptase zinc-binding domain protein [Tanacetum coccineum]
MVLPPFDSFILGLLWRDLILVKNTWKTFNIDDVNGLIRLKKKLQLLKIAIKAWMKVAKMKSNDKKFNIQQNLLELDKLIDQGKSNDEILCKRSILINDLHEINSKYASELYQKAKIRWSIEGDENSKYFHGIINKRRSQLAIRGVLVDGDWISDPATVDFEKAFDSVKWDYLDETLKAFGFGQKWCTWISGCLKNAMGSVLVNGSPSSEIRNAGLYKGISLNNSFTISHLFYADDVVFVGEWNDKNIHTLLNVLKCFFLASGLKINLNKIKLMGIGVNKSVVESAANLIGCSILYSPFNYLGVKVGANMSRISSWDDVVAKVSSRLSKWKIKTLSIGGRLTLLKSVLTSIPLYHMSIYKVPMGVLKKLESIRRNFFNCTDGSVRKSSWTSWSKVLASKKNGGLGVSSFFAHNRALLFKWVWHFFTDESSLWSSFIKALFGIHGALGCFIQKKIGNGEKTLFWDDIWSGDIAFKDQFKRLYALEVSKSISVAEKLGHHSICHSFCRLPRGGIEQELYNLLCSKVDTFVLPNMADRWSWSLEGSGLFSVKSSRNLIDDKYLPKADVPTRWVNVLPIKVNVFAWKVFLDSLPTRLNISLRGIGIPSIFCPVCNLAVESTTHIFFSCSVTRKVWRKVLIWWDLDDAIFHSYNDWILWLVNIRLPKQLKEFLEGICYVMWWLIWRFRNQLLFSNSPPKLESLFDDVVQMSYLWMHSRLPDPLLLLVFFWSYIFHAVTLPYQVGDVPLTCIAAVDYVSGMHVASSDYWLASFFARLFKMTNFSVKHSIMTREMVENFCNNYYIPDEVHPVAPGRDKTITQFPEEMGLLDFIKTADPRKVQAVEVQKKDDQVKLLESTSHCFMSLVTPAAGGSSSAAAPEVSAPAEVEPENVVPEDTYLDLTEPDADLAAARPEEVATTQSGKSKRKRLVKQSDTLPAKQLRKDHPSLATGTGGKTLAGLRQLMPTSPLVLRPSFQADIQAHVVVQRYLHVYLLFDCTSMCFP